MYIHTAINVSIPQNKTYFKHYIKESDRSRIMKIQIYVDFGYISSNILEIYI